MNTSPQAAIRWLDSGNRTLQEIELYAPDEHGIYQSMAASSTRPFADRPLLTANFVFPLVLPSKRPVDVYMRVRSTGYAGITLTPRLWIPVGYQAHAKGETAQWFTYLGFGAALALFNLMLYVYARDICYLLYVLSLVSVMWLISSIAGGYGAAFEYFWPNSPVFEQTAWAAAVLVQAIFGVIFILRLLEFWSKRPGLSRVIATFLGLTILVGGFDVVITASQVPNSASLLQKAWVVGNVVWFPIFSTMLYGILTAAWSGDRLAKFVALAYSPIIVCGLFFAYSQMTGGEYPISILMWASAFELFVMALALADRFNQFRIEKAHAQAALIEGLRQSERELESKVEQRTAEVKAQAAQLDEWNHTLEQRVHEQVDQIERLGRLRRFFSPQLAEAIVADGEEALKTHRREISVVFIDLRGFSAFTDRAEPEEVIEMLHAFHATMGRIIMEHSGTLERFAGDSIMIFFNDPVPIVNHAEKAVRMALAMQKACRQLSAEWRQRSYELGLGCGIALGYATLGEIGFEGRWDYAAIGSVTNLAARLCAEAGSGEVLVDRKVMGKVESLVHATSVGPLVLKGIGQPVPAFSLTGLDSAT